MVLVMYTVLLCPTGTLALTPSQFCYDMSRMLSYSYHRYDTSAKERKRLVGNIYRDQVLEVRVIYKILKQMKSGNNTDDRMKTDLKKTIRTAALIGAVTSSIEGDHQICIKSPALVHGTSVCTIFFCSSQGYQAHKEECWMGS
jgi:hypothetical protein